MALISEWLEQCETKMLDNAGRHRKRRDFAAIEEIAHEFEPQMFPDCQKTGS